MRDRLVVNICAIVLYLLIFSTGKYYYVLPLAIIQIIALTKGFEE